MTQEALNIAGQCRATASSPLAKNILVDEGNGLLTELLLDAARIIEALAQPEQEPVKWSDYEPDGMHHNKPQKRPQNCGTGYCSCIECVMEPPQRTWVDVPDEEIKILWIQYRAALPRYLCFAKALLARAKEENT